MVRRQDVVEWPKPFEDRHLQRLASLFGYTDDYVADYPVHDPGFRWRIGDLIVRGTENPNDDKKDLVEKQSMEGQNPKHPR